MMTTTAPLILTTTPIETYKTDGEFTRRHGVILISILEMLCCLSGSILYIYTLAIEPDWARFLVPIPDGLCSSPNIVHGVMYTFVLLFLMEFFQAVCLFDGARRESLGRVRFWLYSMLTYLILVSVFVIGMELGGVRSPTMNSVAFVNIFLRFIEIMIVYAWAEQETMKRVRFSNNDRRNFGRRRNGRLNSNTGLSSLTIDTIVENNNEEDDDEDDEENEPPTPPPSYESSTLLGLGPSFDINSPRPSTSKQGINMNMNSKKRQIGNEVEDPNQILPVENYRTDCDPEMMRTKKSWRKQWE